jgi:hypothetical protein
LDNPIVLPGGIISTEVVVLIDDFLKAAVRLTANTMEGRMFTNFATRLRTWGLLFLLVPPFALNAQQAVPDNVLDMFDNRCAFAGCHAGPNAPQGLDLTEEFIVPSLVNQASTGKSGMLRVKGGDPANSYLIMKVKGAPGIDGDPMPKSGERLTAAEIAILETWITSLPADMKRDAPEREYAQAFPGLSSATLPTTETLEKGTFSYRIAHRWDGPVDSGIYNFFGLDFGAHIFTELSFPITDNLMVYFGRSGEGATYEFAGKWRLLREKTDGSMPVSVAVVGGLDWETRKDIAGVSNSRTSSERFHWFAQVPASMQIGDRISVLLVPGVLLNGNPTLDGEDPIITIGFAGKIMLFKDFSVFVEGVPIVAGSEGAATVTIGGLRSEDGDLVFNDSFTLGLERRVGGHVFHVYITNSLGLTSNQYMSGGDFDFLNGDFRLGFNIYRVLRWPF